MDIADDFFDVSHRSSNLSLRDYASQSLTDWTTKGLTNKITPLGSMNYIESEESKWFESINFFEYLANSVDDHFVASLRKKPMKYSDGKYRLLESSDIKPKERSPNDIRLVSGLLDLVIRTLRLKDDSGDALGKFVVQGGLVNLNKFADLYEFSLQHQLDKNFVRTALRNLVRSMKITSNYKLDTVSNNVRMFPLMGEQNLYFAYGSNMSHEQMLHRTPGATFLGLADLNNFAYYIDGRGVASVIPKVGANVKGMLWDIKDEADWQSLDRYEGVANGYYNRSEAKVMRGDQFVSATVYISTDTSTGSPRPGYQEKIISSVSTQLDRVEKDINRFNEMRGDSEAYYEVFGFSHDEVFERWIRELDSWLEK